VSNPEERDRQQKPPYLDPALIVDTRLREIERQQAEEKGQQQEYNRKQLRFNGLLVLFTGLLFLTSIGSDFLLLRQTSISKESANAAKSAADTAQGVLAQNKIESTAQAIRNREALEASAKQSKAALDASIQSARLDQRAWVGISQISGPSFTDAKGAQVYIREGVNDRVVSATVANSGKTPALKFQSRTAMRGQPANSIFVPGYQVELGSGSGASFTVIQPGGRAVLPSGRAMAPMPKAGIDGIVNGAITIYFYGELKYEDVYGKPHATHFCMKLEPTLVDFRDCPAYNDAN
jgi:hypothetical protein